MLNLADIITALKAGATGGQLENEALDFKQEDPNVKKTLEVIADAVVCFANANGGSIVLGIADNVAGAAAISGVSSRLDSRSIVLGIYERTRPGLSVPITEHTVDGKRLIEITVPAGATFYANAKGTSTRRIGTQCQPFPPEQQRQALAARGLYDWSEQPSGARRVSEEEMVRVRRLLRAADRRELADQSDQAILTDLRLLTSDGQLNRAGLLIAGHEDDIRELLPAYGYSYQYRPSPGAEAVDRFRGRRPILAAIEQLINAIEARRQMRPLNLAGGVQLQLQDYPQEAVRELVVNAFVHRDFEVAGSADIEQSPEQLRIVSPGGLVFGVTAENILSHPSTPRNRLLLETVTALHVAERAGQGIDRAYRYLLRAGKKPPTFTDSGQAVEARVPGGAGNDAFARYVNGHLPDALAGDIEVLLVLDALCNQRAAQAEAIAPLLQRSVAEAQSTLERMRASGLLEPTRRTASRAFPNYVLASSTLTGLGLAVTYHRRNADDADDKVIEHIREYGYITNQTLRRLFDLEMFPARDMLRDLQARAVIVKLEGQARGPGVRYGRGPKFPS
ncbi:RNA-binding domain-containing protein [Microbacterium album]|uniref:Schlafen AlbA-2 domain-containing protein n=1 Tax=Microbacterium album TaxID=2053191 RepID=A0A917IGA7_9MICO|nr:RNA-binding domain-containing protein [Microbacterium album]GGH46885.1 hypothetical protein GCM10010921_23250 [Microbacterium album]